MYDLDIKHRSWPRCYDYEQVVKTQDDAAYQIDQWREMIDKFNLDRRGVARAICKMAYWRSVLEAQQRRGITFEVVETSS